MDDIRKDVVKFLTEYGFRILGAAIIMVAGAIVARWVGRVVDNFFKKKELEPPLRNLTVRVIRLLVFALAAVLALDKCGVPIAPMVAGIGVAGVGIGLAMQGVLSNIVAGLTIIFTKPFRVGQYIELLGVEGLVQSIELFNTTLLHGDQSRVVIPNRKIIGEILHNYGTIRQLDLTFRVSYDTNIAETLTLIRDIVSRNPMVLKEHTPWIAVTGFADSSINIAIKPWVLVSDFGPAAAQLNQAVFDEFRKRKIEIPFPQRDVRLLNGRAEPVTGVGAEAKRL
jgi:small conductance mechanosensitive channel